MQHIPVLLEEVIKILDPRPGDFIIDGTVDGGGHAEAILKKIGKKGQFLGVDLDGAILEQTKKRFENDGIFKLVLGSYADLPEILKNEKLGQADGLLLDLGFSSEQLASGRGFTFSKDEPLLMTYSDSERPVKDWLKKLRESDLADIIFKYGGERYSRRIAKAIKSKRGIETSGELAAIVRGALPRGYERGRIDPATRTFQALRIFANHELENLENILNELTDIVKVGGKVAIISFHSLEDKMVKEKFRDMSKKGKAELIVKKPLVASEEEERENPRARSAKLRGITII